MEYSSSDSELSDSDRELQEAFAEGKLKPGLNTVHQAPKQFVNNTQALKQKLEEISLDLPWIERLDFTSDQAPLAPELAAQLLAHEQKRENQLKNNKKLPQLKPSDDPVLNDFKREMAFHRQAQATILDAIPKLKALGLPTKRPEDYFAEMAKTDEHMQKIREHLMQKQQQQQRSERVKQLRQQRKEGKMLQVQTKLQRAQEKKEMLDQVKKYRKGVSKDLDFLDSKKSKALSRKALEKRKMKDRKFGFGGKKKGLKQNTKESASDISEYRRPKPANKGKGNKPGNKNVKNRPGKNRRIKARNKK
ncbi:probable rRNA-processing protein EBP2 homolog [Anthonomus grandis grandis]|uniref:probable rRNA-processing protein EBP2 homolog n=1 Tax=Anthonomus grandis grandis TaxID=2921223 RepID=UPI00216528D6|nr:probable rRNA-processing protein EBP2 homolog [Anthonomus grandis grandis]